MPSPELLYILLLHCCISLHICITEQGLGVSSSSQEYDYHYLCSIIFIRCQWPFPWVQQPQDRDCVRTTLVLAQTHNSGII